MAHETLEIMWNIMKENEFQTDVAIKSEFSCTSCKRIMVKACNVPCGCLYCFDCLKRYLNDEEKFCIGQSDYCKSELINIDKNVFIDLHVNIKISRISVKCPIESCEFIGELGKMLNHMRTCDRQPVACPYYTIGCEKNKIGGDKMKMHLKEGKLFYARLLMDFVDNWKNEMNLLKTTMMDLQEENKWIKEQMGSKQEAISALQESKKKLDQIEINQGHARSILECITKDNTSLRLELEIIKSDNKEMMLAVQRKSEKEEEEIGKMREKCEFLEKKQGEQETIIEGLLLETKSLKDELGTVKQDMIQQEILLSLQTRFEEQNKTIKSNTEKTEDWKQKIDEKFVHMEKDQKQMETRHDTMTQENGTMKANIDEMTQENAATKAKSEQSENAIKILETKFIHIQTNQNCEFLWCVQNWDEKKKSALNGIETEICSDPFYSHKNGYKMCLQLYPDGEGTGEKTHLSLFVCVMQGEFDNILQWPFRHEIKLDLLNQNTGLPHHSEILSSGEDQTNSSWQKPCSEGNNGYGFDFIELSELSSNAALCQGNQIWFRATTEIKA